MDLHAAQYASLLTLYNDVLQLCKLLIHHQITQRFNTTQQHHSLINFTLTYTATVLHIDLAGNKFDLASAAHPLCTG